MPLLSLEPTRGQQEELLAVILPLTEPAATGSCHRHRDLLLEDHFSSKSLLVVFGRELVLLPWNMANLSEFMNVLQPLESVLCSKIFPSPLPPPLPLPQGQLLRDNHIIKEILRRCCGHSSIPLSLLLSRLLSSLSRPSPPLRQPLPQESRHGTLRDSEQRVGTQSCLSLRDLPLAEEILSRQKAIS
jgi:hypothetical protein